MDAPAGDAPACAARSVLGRRVVGMDDGEVWGEVVARERSGGQVAYRLSSGRIAKRKSRGYVWEWDDTGPATATITLVPGGMAGDAVTMPREVACAQSDTLAGLLEGGHMPARFDN